MLRVLSPRDWDDMQIDLKVNLHVGFKIRFECVVPVFLELNGSKWHVLFITSAEYKYVNTLQHFLFRPNI